MNTQERVVIGFIILFVVSCMTMISAALLPPEMRVAVVQIAAVGMVVSFLILMVIVAHESTK